MTAVNSREHLSGKSLGVVVFSAIAVLLAVTAFLVSGGFPRGARLFPQVVSALVVILALASIAATFYRARKAPVETAAETDYSDLTSDTTFGEVLPYVIWIIGTYGAMYLIGFFPAAGLFCVLFLWRVAHMKWLGNLAMTAVCLLTVLALGIGLNISWPRGLLPSLLS